MQLVDTHCHIHSTDYPLPIDQVEQNAQNHSVTRLICVGTDSQDSQHAVQFVQNRPNHWASIGIHPHEAEKEGEGGIKKLEALLASEKSQDSEALSGRKEGTPNFAADLKAEHKFGRSLEDEAQGAAEKKIIAIGECGLDYYYKHSPKPAQIQTLRSQIELALAHNLPLIFHVREAFDDFWPIFDSYTGIRGVLHSYTDSAENLEHALQRNLYIGINGIMTFTKNQWQRDLVHNLPLKSMLLETDSPFLTPVPYRGKINEPANISAVVNFLSELRNEPPENIADATTKSARQLFSI